MDIIDDIILRSEIDVVIRINWGDNNMIDKQALVIKVWMTFGH